MRVTEAAEPTFARHETFHPRYGWFRKAYTFALEDERIFTRDDAPVVIGVGKNMVRSIRFWGLAAKLIVVDPESPNRRVPDIVPTHIGHALFSKSGWDRYMEDPGTLWLLHWLLFAPPSKLPVWWLAFNEFNAVEFTDNDLEMAITTHIDAITEWKRPHQSSVKKDISVLFRTYAPAERLGRTRIDDLLDCPLRELNLIGRSPATNRHRFTLGSKATLPSAIVAYAVLDYISRTGVSGSTVTLSRLANESGAPGRAFKLTETQLLTAIEPTVHQVDALNLSTLNGATQLVWSDDPTEVGSAMLDRYYGSKSTAVKAGHASDQALTRDVIDMARRVATAKVQ